jgi:hypothetical protein
MTRHQEDNIMGWLIILMITLFVGATCKASQNSQSQDPPTMETK